MNGDIDVCGCVSNPAFYKFMDKYVSDVYALFPSQYVHVGLDETFDFAVCEECQKRIKNGEREVLCAGQMKSSAVAFEVGGCYHYRLATKAEKIEKLTFSVYGEGAL